MPIPTHLAGILKPIGDQNNENQVTGALVCPCGGTAFSISYIGEDEKDRQGIIRNLAISDYNDSYLLAVKVICSQCGREHIVFDSSHHGWDGFVCHDDDIELESSNFHKGKFCECGSPAHSITVNISSQGEDDFIQEAGDEFDPNDWVNGFDWIQISAVCSHCGRGAVNFVDEETM